MKLIKPSFEIIDQKPEITGLLQHIEKCGRVAYKSEDKIAEDSAGKFVGMLINRGHTAVLEHGTVYLKFNNAMPNLYHLVNKYENNPYSVINNHTFEEDSNSRGVSFTEWYVTTNYRVLLQNGWLDDLRYRCEPTESHEKRITVKFTCDRGISHEYVRHRTFSFVQESTRYCNYSKDKFSNEITFILPPWVDERQLGEQDFKELLVQMGNLNSPQYTQKDLEELYFLFGLASSEAQYFALIDKGWKPQQARAVLPNSLKTELIMTGTIGQWEGFFKLRIANDAHPQARELAVPLKNEFVKQGFINKD